MGIWGTPLTELENPAKALSGASRGRCLTCTGRNRTKPQAGVSCLLACKLKELNSMFKFLILFCSMIRFQSLPVTVASLRTRLSYVCPQNIIVWGLGETGALIIVLSRARIQQHGFHFSLTRPYFPFTLPVPAWAHYLGFGLLCELLRAVVSYSYHVTSQSAPACRHFRTLWFHLCVSQMRGETWGDREASRVPGGLRFDGSIPWSVLHCLPFSLT